MLSFSSNVRRGAIQQSLLGSSTLESINWGTSGQQVPVVLSVCKESRDEPLKFWEPSSRFISGLAVEYINPELHVFIFPEVVWRLQACPALPPRYLYPIATFLFDISTVWSISEDVEELMDWRSQQAEKGRARLRKLTPFWFTLGFVYAWQILTTHCMDKVQIDETSGFWLQLCLEQIQYPSFTAFRMSIKRWTQMN